MSGVQIPLPLRKGLYNEKASKSMRGSAVRQRVGPITRRSSVRIWPPPLRLIFPRGCGGIGRRTTLKTWRGKPLASSTLATRTTHLAPVAQLDRADGFYPSGCGFESYRGHKAMNNGRWCNWQHAWFWTTRFEVRDLVGQPNTHVRVVQRMRTSAYGAESREFESLHAHSSNMDQ
jgi:hypothetical protein